MFRAAFPAAEAVTPEQLAHYALAVGGGEAGLYGGFPGYLHRDSAGDGGTSLVLVAFPPVLPVAAQGPEAMPFTESLDLAVAEALAVPELARITVLAPERPSAAPADAPTLADSYLGLDLPLQGPTTPLPQKLRNMLARPERELSFAVENWDAEHTALVEGFITTRPLAPGTRHIFRAVPAYLDAAPEARLFTARTRCENTLCALAVGDFTSLSTAFYMFAFRLPTAPPGTADALLYRLACEAETRGHSQLNLGLGIDGGIRAFKRKWRARELMPHTETTWTLAKPRTFWNGLSRFFTSF